MSDQQIPRGQRPAGGQNDGLGNIAYLKWPVIIIFIIILILVILSDYLSTHP